MILAHQADYYVALKTANTQGNSTVFLEFILEMILEALKIANVEQHNTSINPSSDERLLALLKSGSHLTSLTWHSILDWVNVRYAS